MLGMANLLCELFVCDDDTSNKNNNNNNNNNKCNNGWQPIIKFTKLEDVDKLPDILYAYSSFSSGAMMIDTTTNPNSTTTPRQLAAAITKNSSSHGTDDTTTNPCGVAISTSANGMKHDTSLSTKIETKKQSSDKTLVAEEQSVQNDDEGIVVGLILKTKKFGKKTNTTTSSS